MSKVSVVLTSCGRPHLLEPTINSFNKYNTYPIEEFIIIDDSGDLPTQGFIKSQYPKYTHIFNSTRIGQIKSIDKAYSQVKTPYIFHLEDDWEFYEKGFIEKSLVLLKDDPTIINVWLRERNDTNGHEILPTQYECNKIFYYLLSTNWREGWGGFSFNPGLRRLSDYKKVQPFENFIPTPSPSKFYTPELELSKHYKKLGYKAAILSKGCVKHIGWNDHIKN